MKPTLCFISALAVGALLPCIAPGAHAEVLGSGYAMGVGQRLYSANRAYYAMLAPDGTLAVHRADGSIHWSTPTAGSGATRITMQRDGNAVLTNDSGRALWHTATGGRHRMLGVGNGGSLVVINAKRWKPRHRWAEPKVEDILTHNGKLTWQSPAPDYVARFKPPEYDKPKKKKRKAAAPPRP
jgi:hypothetical protein